MRKHASRTRVRTESLLIHHRLLSSSSSSNFPPKRRIGSFWFDDYCTYSRAARGWVCVETRRSTALKRHPNITNTCSARCQRLRRGAMEQEAMGTAASIHSAARSQSYNSRTLWLQLVQSIHKDCRDEHPLRSYSRLDQYSSLCAFSVHPAQAAAVTIWNYNLEDVMPDEWMPPFP